MKFVREQAVIEEELIWQPSGMRVHLEAYTSPSSARVRTASGKTYNVAMDNLEHIEKPGDVDGADMFNEGDGEAT